MQRLLQCMAIPQAAEAAAAAFRNLCVRCTSKLHDSSVLGALIHAVRGLLSQGELMGLLSCDASIEYISAHVSLLSQYFDHCLSRQAP